MSSNKYSLTLNDNISSLSHELEGEYLSYLDIANEQDIEKISLIGKALSVPIRVKIINVLNVRPMTLSEIAKKFDLQVSSVAFHMQILLEANLISVCESPQKKGHLKWHSYPLEKALLIKLRDFTGENQYDETKIINYDIGIGEFIDINVDKETSGMASEVSLLTDVNGFNMFCKERFLAQILWTTHGFITYPISNNILQNSKIKSLEISLEICSEARGYNENFPSDITFLLNDIELCTYMCPGDYGDRYGKYTPNWWYPESTKYGLLTIITIRDDGVYLNGIKVNKNVTINNLNFEKNYSTFTIKVKDDAIHKGGFNLFGEKFGDYNQGIRITINKQ